MQRSSLALAVALIVSSYGAIPLDARTIVLRAGWRETRSILAQPEFRPKLQIQLKSNKKMKGRVSGTTSAGLTLERNGEAILIERTKIHSVRLVPRKARGHRYRMLALAGGVPAGLGAALGSWHIGCNVAGGCEEPPHPAGSAGYYAVLVAVPVLLYRLAARTDRGALLIVLDESVAHSLLLRPGPHPATNARLAQSSEALNLSATEDPCFSQPPFQSATRSLFAGSRTVLAVSIRRLIWGASRISRWRV